MSKVKNVRQLIDEIQNLEQSIILSEKEIKNNFSKVKSDLEPKNAVRNIFSLVAETPEIKKALVQTAIGLGLVYAFKKSKELLSEESLTHLLSSALNYGLEKIEEGNPEGMITKGIHILRRITPPDSPYAPFVHRYYYDKNR